MKRYDDFIDVGRVGMEFAALGKTGLQVSRIAFGASGLGNAFRTIEPSEGAAAVREAIELGINLFDVSPYYGLTLAETRLGEALQGLRSQVILSTKCGRYGAEEFDFSAGRITAGLDASLRRLRTDHVDVLLAHDVEFGSARQILEETIPAMRRLQADGKTRWIGISGYPLKMLERLMRETPVDVVLTYCRYNPLIEDMARTLLPLAQAAGVGLINASPLHMGILAGGEVPPWHPADAEVKSAGGAYAAACRQAGVNPGAAALRFCLQNTGVATTLVGMASPAEVQENVAALHTTVPDALCTRLEAIVGPVKNRVWRSGLDENN